MTRNDASRESSGSRVDPSRSYPDGTKALTPPSVSRPVDLEAWERLARAATPGPWTFLLDDEGRGHIYGPDGFKIHDFFNGTVEAATGNAEFIASCSPERILGLIDAAQQGAEDAARLVELDHEVFELKDARDNRQRRVAEWVVRTFGPGTMTPAERIARFVEEALELAQACGYERTAVDRLADHVYGKPAGVPRQEAGGVGITLLGVAAAFRFSADDAELSELERVEAIPADYFRKRHDAKADAGIAVYSAAPDEAVADVSR